jgi:hypothetical protein
MSQQQFNTAAQESILFAQFKAETAGVSYTQIDLWMRAFAARCVA